MRFLINKCSRAGYSRLFFWLLCFAFLFIMPKAWGQDSIVSKSNSTARVDFFNNTQWKNEAGIKEVAAHLSAAVQFQTISGSADRDRYGHAFLQFHDFLRKTYPHVFTSLTCELANQYSMLLTWKGQNPRLEPVLLIAHQDVVPVDSASAGQWTEPPFSGRIKDGYIWGRGAMDDKVSVLGILEAVEQLLKNGYRPMRDIYFAFGDDEETAGAGASAINQILKSRNLHFAYILDEGGGIIDGAIPYVERPVAFIGIAEKGYLTLSLDVHEAGGHSSMPADEGVVGILGKAIYRLQDNPFPARLTLPVKEMFRELGKNMPGINGFIATHPQLFAGILKKEMSANPVTFSLIQTTIAPTMMNAGVQENIMPASARMTINFRILPGETVQTVIARVRHTIHDKRIEINIAGDAWNPSKTAGIKSRSYKILKHSIEQVFPKTSIVPALNASISDSRNYAKLSNNILHFVPIVMKKGDADRIHGVNERLSVANYTDCVTFYYHLIVNSDLQL